MNLHNEDATVVDQAAARFQASFARVGPSMGLTAEAIAVLVRSATFARFEAGTPIVFGTNRNVMLYFLVDGAVRVTCNVPRQALTVEFVGPGRFFGLGSLFDPPGPRCLGAIAHTACLVAIISPDTLADAIATLPPGGALQLLAYSWRGLSRLVYRKSRSMVMSLHERVLAELRVLARDFGDPGARGSRIRIPLTTSDVATLVGTTRTAASRAMARLQSAGVIERDRGRLVLLDPSVPDARGDSTKPRNHDVASLATG